VIRVIHVIQEKVSVDTSFVHAWIEQPVKPSEPPRARPAHAEVEAEPAVALPAELATPPIQPLDADDEEALRQILAWPADEPGFSVAEAIAAGKAWNDAVRARPETDRQRGRARFATATRGPASGQDEPPEKGPARHP
jgi:hypothetical protein